MKIGKLIFIFFIFIALIGCTTKPTINIEYNNNETKQYQYLIAGSGSNLPITKKLIEAYNKNHNQKIELPPSIGSSGAIQAVKSGELALGLTSRPLKEDEKDTRLIEVPYATIGIVIGVNETVQETNISYQELLDITLGKKRAWKNGEMIIVIAREEGDSSNRILSEMIPGFENALTGAYKNDKWEIAYTDLESANEIANVNDAIGLTDTTTIEISYPQIKPLSINHIAPSTENIENGRYKLVKDLYFIYDKTKLPDWSKSFLDFVYSDDGQKILDEHGSIPIKGSWKND